MLQILLDGHYILTNLYLDVIDYLNADVNHKLGTIKRCDGCYLLQQTTPNGDMVGSITSSKP